jgi:hypothetical protein
MKLKEGFVLKEIAGECVVVSANADLDLDGVISLNSTAQTLWLALEKGVESIDELVDALLAEYEVEEARAREAAEHFVARLKELDFLA